MCFAGNRWAQNSELPDSRSSDPLGQGALSAQLYTDAGLGPGWTGQWGEWLGWGHMQCPTHTQRVALTKVLHEDGCWAGRRLAYSASLLMGKPLQKKSAASALLGHEMVGHLWPLSFTCSRNVTSCALNHFAQFFYATSELSQNVNSGKPANKSPVLIPSKPCLSSDNFLSSLWFILQNGPISCQDLLTSLAVFANSFSAWLAVKCDMGWWAVEWWIQSGFLAANRRDTVAITLSWSLPAKVPVGFNHATCCLSIIDTLLPGSCQIVKLHYRCIDYWKSDPLIEMGRLPEEAQMFGKSPTGTCFSSRISMHSCLINSPCWASSVLLLRKWEFQEEAPVVGCGAHCAMLACCLA